MRILLCLNMYQLVTKKMDCILMVKGSHVQCFIPIPRLRGGGGGMNSGEAEGAHRATFFACLQELLGEF
jgi:hypothetical protein